MTWRGTCNNCLSAEVGVVLVRVDDLPLGVIRHRVRWAESQNHKSVEDAAVSPIPVVHVDVLAASRLQVSVPDACPSEPVTPHTVVIPPAASTAHAPHFGQQPQSVSRVSEPHDVSRLTQGQPSTPVVVQATKLPLPLPLPGVIAHAHALLLGDETKSNVGY